MNLVPLRADGFLRALFIEGSGQQQIGQRDHGGGGADQDQGVIGSEIVLHVERWLLVGHARDLGQGSPGVCEVIHIRSNFFVACSGNGCLVQRLVVSRTGTGDGPRTSKRASNMAVGEGRTAVAVAPDRHHGTDRPAHHAKPPGRPAGAGKGSRPVEPAGVLSLWRCWLPPLTRCGCAAEHLTLAFP